MAPATPATRVSKTDEINRQLSRAETDKRPQADAFLPELRGAVSMSGDAGITDSESVGLAVERHSSSSSTAAKNHRSEGEALFTPSPKAAGKGANTLETPAS
jgi:hypothetical protein